LLAEETYDEQRRSLRQNLSAVFLVATYRNVGVCNGRKVKNATMALRTPNTQGTAPMLFYCFIALLLCCFVVLLFYFFLCSLHPAQM